jgi:hypothetical protein
MRSRDWLLMSWVGAAVACGNGEAGGGGVWVNISGSVFSAFCATEPAVTVEVLDDSSVSTTTDADGQFALRLPGTATMRASASGFVPTISSLRSYADGQTGVELALVPQIFSELVHGLAGFELSGGLGTIALGILDAGSLPISGAEVELVPEGAGDTSTVSRRYVLPDEVLFDFADLVGTSTTGIVMFFDVEPGTYRVESRREGYALDDLVLEVRGGTITLDLVRGTGSGGTAPRQMEGVVRAPPAFPMAGDWAPLASAAVVLTAEDGTTVSTVTDDAGRYMLSVPFIRRWVDITVEGSSTYPLRSRMWCMTEDSQLDFDLADHFFAEREIGWALGAEPLQPDAGTLIAFTRDTDGTALAGATLAIEPPLREPMYGEDYLFAMRCAVASCAGGETCPDGSRCQSGECVAGDSGPLCDSCDAAACAEGYTGWSLLRHGGEATGCYCMPVQPTQCDLVTPTCEAGTYCWEATVQNGATWQIPYRACYLHRPLATSTVVWADNSREAMFVNVPAGLYRVSGDSPLGALGRRRVRISDGVMTTVSLSPEP